jgi:hypothetical protein
VNQLVEDYIVQKLALFWRWHQDVEIEFRAQAVFVESLLHSEGGTHEAHTTKPLGEDAIGGTFTSSKPGDWIALKLFLADGEGEVYMNLDPVAGQGEFAAKDPEYAEVVLRELARVFGP